MKLSSAGARKALPLLIAFLALTCLPAWGAAPAVRTAALPNGLLLLVKEVHTAPVVSVYTWYRVGSRNECPGRLGISHLLEHMAFKGSSRFAQGEISRLVTSKGGWDNGYTWQDWTAYVETVPSRYLDLALAIEADRMAALTLDSKELAAEKTVVISELEGDENSPSFYLDTAVRATAFTAHPYMFRTIGYQSDLASCDRPTLHAWYRTYYAPGNATLVVVGDVQFERVLAKARYYFGRIPGRAAPPRVVTVEPPQEGERRVVVRRPGAAGYVEVAYHVPPVGHADRYALDVAENVLSSGRTGRLYQALVDTALASEASAYQYENRDPTLFEFFLTLRQEVGHQQAEDALLAALDKLKTEPPSPQELQKAVNQARASFVYEMDSVTDQGFRLGFYQSIVGHRYLDTYLARIARVTAQDVQRVIRTYFTADNLTVGWFIPTGPAQEAPAGVPAPQPAGYRPRVPAPAAAAPAAGPAPAPAVSVPKSSRFVLPNGVVLVVQENHAVGAVAVGGMLRAGAIYDPPGQAGLANLVAAGLSRGTATRTWQQIAGQLEFVAASTSFSGGVQVANISGRCLSGDLELLVELLADQLRQPNFPEPEVAKLRGQAETALEEANADTGEVAERAFLAALYPEGHPLRHVPQGELEQVRTITRQDLVDFHRRYYRPDTLILTVVGDVQPARVRELADKYLGNWQAPGPPPAINIPPAPQPARPVTITRSLPGKTQTDIALGAVGISRRSPDYHAALLLNYILGGGGFSSRLTEAIRDQQGLAYYVYSQYRAYYGDGPWLLRMGVNPANVSKAVAAALAQMRKVQQQGVTDREMALWQDYAAGSLALRMETNEGVANSLADAEFYGLGLDYPYRLPALLAALSRQQVQAAARKYLHPEAYVLVTAGPSAQP